MFILISTQSELKLCQNKYLLTTKPVKHATCGMHNSYLVFSCKQIFYVVLVRGKSRIELMRLEAIEEAMEINAGKVFNFLSKIFSLSILNYWLKTAAYV